MMIKLTLQEIFAYLETEGYAPELQNESNQILISMTFNHQTIPLLVGLLAENSLVQVLCYLPYKLQLASFDKTALLLHMFNRKIDLPGFGMDEEHHLLFYRSVFPLMTIETAMEMLDFYMLSTRITIDSFMEGVGPVLSGEIPVEEALQKLRSK